MKNKFLFISVFIVICGLLGNNTILNAELQLPTTFNLLITSGVVITEGAQYDWEDSTHPDGPVRYILCLSTGSDFSIYYNFWDVTYSSATDLPSDIFTYLPPRGVDKKDIYWRVFATTDTTNPFDTSITPFTSENDPNLVSNIRWNENGIWSFYVFYGPPDLPTSLYGEDIPSDDGTKIDLYWTKPTDPNILPYIAGYRIYYKAYLSFTSTSDAGVVDYTGSLVNKNVSSFTITGLTPDVDYYFAVVPVKTDGKSLATLTPLGPFTPMDNSVDITAGDVTITFPDSPKVKIIIPSGTNIGVSFDIIKVSHAEGANPGHSKISIVNTANELAKNTAGISQTSVDTLSSTQYEFKCSSPTLEGYVTIVLFYLSSITGTDESSLRIYRLDETAQKWALAAKDSDQTIDKTNNTVTVRVTRLSIFRILVKNLTKNDLSSVKVYPNPFDSSNSLHTKIKFTNLTQQAKIKIYTLTGLLAKELNVTTDDLGEKTWDLRNDDCEDIASGLYIFVVTNDKGEKFKGKLAIIR